MAQPTDKELCGLDGHIYQRTVRRWYNNASSALKADAKPAPKDDARSADAPSGGSVDGHVWSADPRGGKPVPESCREFNEHERARRASALFGSSTERNDSSDDDDVLLRASPDRCSYVATSPSRSPTPPLVVRSPRSPSYDDVSPPRPFSPPHGDTPPADMTAAAVPAAVASSPPRESAPSPKRKAEDEDDTDRLLADLDRWVLTEDDPAKKAERRVKKNTARNTPFPPWSSVRICPYCNSPGKWNTPCQLSSHMYLCRIKHGVTEIRKAIVIPQFGDGDVKEE